jgi:hypothetical protein
MRATLQPSALLVTEAEGLVNTAIETPAAILNVRRVVAPAVPGATVQSRVVRMTQVQTPLAVR